jgi:hypothetical protein
VRDRSWTIDIIGKQVDLPYCGVVSRLIKVRVTLISFLHNINSAERKKGVPPKLVKLPVKDSVADFRHWSD